jgi:hypothetical protein
MHSSSGSEFRYSPLLSFLSFPRGTYFKLSFADGIRALDSIPTEPEEVRGLTAVRLMESCIPNVANSSWAALHSGLDW